MKVTFTSLEIKGSRMAANLLKHPAGLMAFSRSKDPLTAREKDQPFHLANTTRGLFAAANKNGISRLDLSAIHWYLDKGA